MGGLEGGAAAGCSSLICLLPIQSAIEVSTAPIVNLIEDFNASFHVAQFFMVSPLARKNAAKPFWLRESPVTIDRS